MSLFSFPARSLLKSNLAGKFILQQQVPLTRQASTFLSKCLSSKNIQDLKNKDAAALQKFEALDKKLRKQDDIPAISKHETKLVIQEPEQTEFTEFVDSNTKPVVLLFGWGGASHKNLGKYSSIYLGVGFTTVQYILPTRHIFRDTAQIPHLMDCLLMQLEKVDIYDRPVYVHCLSDTGVMCYQGMDVVRRQSSKMKKMKLQGVIWDSCCGPRPEITVARVIALLGVNWFCCMRDGLGMVLSMNSSYRLLMDRAWPGLIQRWQGKSFELSLIEGKSPIFYPVIVSNFL